MKMKTVDTPQEEFKEEAELTKKQLDDVHNLTFDEVKVQADHEITISKLLEGQDDLKAKVDILNSEDSVLSSKACDVEVVTCNKLLEGEEQIPNLATQNEEQRLGRKRKHKTLEEEATPVDSFSSGFVSISEVDPNGTFVKITNNGTEDEDLEGYMVHRVVDDSDSLNDFKFPNGCVLPPQQSVTIWSKSHGMETNPPFEFVLEGDWKGDGSKISTSIVNVESQLVIARYTLDKADQSSDVPRKIEKKRRASCAVM